MPKSMLLTKITTLDDINDACIIRGSSCPVCSGSAGSLKKSVGTIDKLIRWVKMVGSFGIGGFTLKGYGKQNVDTLLTN